MLTIKQKKFINHYIKTSNGVEAAKLAGYAGSYNTLGVVAHENLNKPKIKAAISERLSNLKMSADKVLVVLSQQAKSDYAEYLQADGGIDLESLLADGKGHLIKSVKRTKHGLNVTFYDSQAALRLLAKYHGLLDDKINLKLESEIDNILDLLESNLDSATYERVLTILSEAKLL